MAINTFTPTASTFLGATVASTEIVLPTTGTPGTVIITNLGDNPAFVALGASGVTVTPQAGYAVMPKQWVALAIGTNTDLAAVTLSGVSGLSITVGN